MKSIKISPLWDKIILVVLFILASLSTFHGFRPILLIISHSGRLSMLIKCIPLILANGIPLTFLIAHWRRMHVKNISSKYKLCYNFVITTLVLSSLAFLLQIICCATQIGWGLYKGASGLYPYDLLVICGGLIVYCIYSLINLNKEKYLKDVPLTFKGEKKNVLVLFMFMTGFTCYETGNVIYGSLSMLGDGIIDPNIGLIIPTILLLLLPLIYLITYLLYKNHFNTRKFYKWSLVSLIIYTVIIVSTVLIILILNPTYVAESMANFMELGLAIKTPLELFVIPVVLLIILIATTVNYVVLSRRDNHEQE